MEAIPVLIGKRMFPLDNSYSFTIGSREHPNLAGVEGTPAKLVLIISEPYKMLVNWKGISEKEFVTVWYRNKHHVVLNDFSEKQPYKYKYEECYKRDKS
jgi:hypothetical protein